jgi:hypothetical protein
MCGLQAGALMSFPPNRRKSVRYAGIANQAWLAWRTEGDSTSVAARVYDISQSGAAVLVEKPPPVRPNDTVWLRMEHPAPSDWVEAHVVAVTAVTKRSLLVCRRVVGHLVRLRFTGSCPYDLFKTATHGTQLNATFQSDGPSESDGVIWR